MDWGVSVVTKKIDTGHKRMQKIVYAIIGGLISASAVFVNAQDMGEMRSEFFYCSLNEGKTMADVKA